MMLRKILFMAMLPLAVCAQNTPNPLLLYTNAPIHFEQVDAAVIDDATTQVIKRCDAMSKAIIAIPAGKQTATNTLMAFDELNFALNSLSGKLSVIGSAYEDDKTRNAAVELNEKLSTYNSNLYLNVGLYQALKRFSLSAAAKTLRADQKKYLGETLVSFEINGTKLSAAGRAALKKTYGKIISFGAQFDRNIAEHQDSITFTAKQVTGVPSGISSAWKRGADKYIITVNGPNFVNIMRYADDPDVRKVMQLRYYNRAYPGNIKTLDSLFFYRQKLVTQLGYKTYAQYALLQKMAAKPSNVWLFLEDLKAKLAPKVPVANAELRGLKHYLNPTQPDSLFAWDGAYYSKKLLDVKYQLNTDEVKLYFEMNNTISGMFTLYQKLFGIDIREAKGMPTWYHKVRSYELFKDGQKMGTFFLDLYPRANKYTHFAAFNLSLYHKQPTGEDLLPVGTLLCNFPEGAPNEPTLLNHGDVVTLFHEFGHLIHFLLAHPAVSSQNAFAVKGDFVEAPSQFLENFCWNYDALKLFAKHYKTGEVLPRTLFDKMEKGRTVGLIPANMFQVYLSMLDFTYEDRYPIAKKQGINNVSINLYKMLQVPFPTGTHFICGFDHLNGYGANYYGYLWSKVYAQDMFSVFEKNGTVNPTVGERYRKLILEKGATQDEQVMLQNFLGRKPNSAAFLKSIGL